MLRTRPPRKPLRKATPLDLHALGTPPALILSQDQTLHHIALAPRKELFPCIAWATRLFAYWLPLRMLQPRPPVGARVMRSARSVFGTRRVAFGPTLSGLRHPSAAPACQRAAPSEERTWRAQEDDPSQITVGRPRLLGGRSSVRSLQSLPHRPTPCQGVHRSRRRHPPRGRPLGPSPQPQYSTTETMLCQVEKFVVPAGPRSPLVPSWVHTSGKGTLAPRPVLCQVTRAAAASRVPASGDP